MPSSLLIASCSVNLLFFLAPGTSAALSTASLLFSGLAAATAVALLALHQHKCVRSCDDAVRHLRHTTGETVHLHSASLQVPFLEWAAEDSNVRAALTWSLPRGLFLWAAALAAAQIPFWIEHALGSAVLGGIAALVVVACLPWPKWYNAFISWNESCRENASEAMV